MSETMNRQQRRAKESTQRKQQAKWAKELQGREDANGWSDLHNIYMECRALTTQPAALIPFLRNKELSDKIKDQTKLHQTATVLTSDATDYNNRLQAIYDGHKHRTGTTTTPDDLMECLAVADKYTDWMMSYQTVVLPHVETLLAMYEEVTDESDKQAPTTITQK